MSHRIEPGGRIDKVCAAYLAKDAAILYHNRDDDEDAKVRRKKAASKTKNTCPVCEINAWAKPDAHLVCCDCEETMEAETDAQADG